MDEELDALKKKIKHGKYACYQKTKNRLVANGFIRSNIIVIVS
jgi:hypothetical protein